MAAAVGFPDSSALVLVLEERGVQCCVGVTSLLFCTRHVIAGGHGFVQKGPFYLALAKRWHEFLQAWSLCHPASRPSCSLQRAPLVLKGTAAAAQWLLVLKQQCQAGGGWQGSVFFALWGWKVFTTWAPPPCCLCSQMCEGGGREWSRSAFVWGDHVAEQLPSWHCLQWWIPFCG